MSLNDTDRRRLIAVTVLTLLALPALWYANTSNNSSAPSLAVAGIDAEVDTAGAVGNADRSPAADQPADDEQVAPAFLDGPSSEAGAGQSEIAVPARPLVEGITAEATFRSNLTDGTCIVGAVPSGTPITVVNLDNNRSITCTSVLIPGVESDVVVIRTSTFATIADLTDAPISVEIRR